MPEQPHLLKTLPPRVLSRGQAAKYLGLGISTFDRLVEAGLMPKPLKLPMRKVLWDRRAIDHALDRLSGMANGSLSQRDLDEGLGLGNR